MVGAREYSTEDRTVLTISLVIIVLILSIILAAYSTSVSEVSLDRNLYINFFPTPLLALFRTFASVVCFLTIGVIALDKKGLTYNVLDYEPRFTARKNNRFHQIICFHNVELLPDGDLFRSLFCFFLVRIPQLVCES